MRLITFNTSKSEYPKGHICDECGAELEYDKKAKNWLNKIFLFRYKEEV